MNAPLGHGPVPALVALLCAYTLGGIPTGLWLGRLVAGVDVRTIGSHRTGATNVQRALGTSAGLAVFAVDVGKGFLAVLLARWLAGDSVAAIAGVVAMVSHMYPALAGFEGGRGVATGAGALLALAPLPALAALACWAVVVALSRYVSLGSIVAGVLVAVWAALLRHVAAEPDQGILLALLAGSVVLLRHGENLRRLRQGTESRLGAGAPPLRPAGKGDPSRSRPQRDGQDT